jgi:hypothetical protein
LAGYNKTGKYKCDGTFRLRALTRRFAFLNHSLCINSYISML